MFGRFVVPLVLALVLSALPLASADELRYNVSLNSQVRTAYAGPYGITISWNTYYHLSQPTVHYGLSPQSLSQVAVSTNSSTYPSSLTYNNHVRISGLQPNTQYYYLPEHLINNTDLVGPFEFKTARLAGDMHPYSVAVVVDMGAMGSEGLTTTAGTGISSDDILMPGEQNTIQSLTAELDTYEFLMQPGDFAYADTWLTEVNQGFLNATTDLEGGSKAYESILDDFYDQLTNVTAKVPFMVGPGNHEANCVDYSYTCPVGQSNFTGFINHFRMPSDVSNQSPDNYGVGNMWYSFDHGMVHYISLDMETDFTGNPDESWGNGPFGYDGEQVAWLTADLKAVNRSLTPWIIVTGHRQWYSSGNGPCTACQTAFETLFNEYAIDLYISGHYHVYERNVPIGVGGVIDPNGLDDPSSPWYIINGVGGHYGGLNPFNHASEYRVFGLSILNATYGWSRLTFHNRTHMTHEFIDSATNVALDVATLYKNHTFATTQTNSSATTSSISSTATSPTSSIISTMGSNTSISASSTSLSSSAAVNSTTTMHSTSISAVSTAANWTSVSTPSTGTYSTSMSLTTSSSVPMISSTSSKSSTSATPTISTAPFAMTNTTSATAFSSTSSAVMSTQSSMESSSRTTSVTTTITTSSQPQMISHSTSAYLLTSTSTSAAAAVTAATSHFTSSSLASWSSSGSQRTLTSSDIASGKQSTTRVGSLDSVMPNIYSTAVQRTDTVSCQSSNPTTVPTQSSISIPSKAGSVVSISCITSTIGSKPSSSSASLNPVQGLSTTLPQTLSAVGTPANLSMPSKAGSVISVSYITSAIGSKPSSSSASLNPVQGLSTTSSQTLSAVEKPTTLSNGSGSSATATVLTSSSVATSGSTTSSEIKPSTTVTVTSDSWIVAAGCLRISILILFVSFINLS